jgi:hypothetical protein
MEAVGNLTERELIGDLLKGTGILFGRRVELSWPDGLPYPKEILRSIGEQWAPRTGARWVVRSDAGFCDTMVPCGHELDSSGSCDRHGRQETDISGNAAQPSPDGDSGFVSMTSDDFAEFTRRYRIRWEET